MRVEGEQSHRFRLTFPRQCVLSLAKHKWCTATVTLREGTGQVTIQSPMVKTSVKDILYFTRILHRLVLVLFSTSPCKSLPSSDQLLYPFKVLDRVNLFDMNIVYDGIGFTAQAIATRLAISKALCSFISSKEVEHLRLGNLVFSNQPCNELFFFFFFF